MREKQLLPPDTFITIPQCTFYLLYTHTHIHSPTHSQARTSTMRFATKLHISMSIAFISYCACLCSIYLLCIYRRVAIQSAVFLLWACMIYGHCAAYEQCMMPYRAAIPCGHTVMPYLFVYIYIYITSVRVYCWSYTPNRMNYSVLYSATRPVYPPHNLPI